MAFPTTFLDVQNAVIRKLRLDATADLAKVKDWINQAYADAAAEVGPVALTTTLNMVAGTKTYTFPSTVYELKGMFVTASAGYLSPPLERVDIDTIIRFRRGSGGSPTQTGTVTHYALIGLTGFEVYPTPQAADVITIYATGLPTALAADADVPVLPEPFSKFLEYWALAEAADFKSDPQEQEYRALAEDWKRRLRVFVNRRRAVDHFEIKGGVFFVPHDPSTDWRP